MHIRDETLSSWLEGDLPESEQARVTEHLEGCERCQESVASLRDLVRRARELPAAPAEWPGKAEAWTAMAHRLRRPDRRFSSHRRSSPAAGPAAGLAAVAILAAVLLIPAPEPAGGPETTPSDALATLLEADSRVAADVERLVARGEWGSEEARHAIVAANREIDRGVATLRDALRERPDDPALMELARRAAGHRMDLIREVVR